MAVTQRSIVRKEILPCHCMRYVYDKGGIDVVHCQHHAQQIEGRDLKDKEVKALLARLYLTEEAFVPKPKTRISGYVYAGGLVAAMLGVFYVGVANSNATPKTSTTSYRRPSTTPLTWRSYPDDPSRLYLDIANRPQLFDTARLTQPSRDGYYPVMRSADWSHHDTASFPQLHGSRTDLRSE